MKLFGLKVQMPWEPPVARVASARPTPLGTSISQTFSVFGGEEAEPMRHTLAVIDRLHGDGAIPALIVRREKLEELNGQFIPRQGVLIDPKSQIAEFTTAHEVGHVLDFYGFSPQRWESMSGHAMVPIMNACFSSTAYQALRTLRAGLSTPLTELRAEINRQRALKQVNYLLRQDEIWSRAYAQWVAPSSQDRVLLQQLGSLRQDADYAKFWVQWSDADFARIGREIDLLFKRKGWLQ